MPRKTSVSALRAMEFKASLSKTVERQLFSVSLRKNVWIFAAERELALNRCRQGLEAGGNQKAYIHRASLLHPTVMGLFNVSLRKNVGKGFSRASHGLLPASTCFYPI